MGLFSLEGWKGVTALFSCLLGGHRENVESSQKCTVEGQEAMGVIWKGNPNQYKEKKIPQ